MTTYVALLRGVNIAGNRPVDMKALKACCEGLGFTRVATYLRSGNVLFDAGRASPAAVAGRLADAIEADFAFRAPVVLRTPARLAEIVAGNPFTEAAAADPTRVAVMFLDAAPDAGAAARLRAAHGGPEEFALSGADLYLHYPNGVGRSKLTSDLIDRRLGLHGTGRNWNTVLKLLALAGEHGGAPNRGKSR